MACAFSCLISPDVTDSFFKGSPQLQTLQMTEAVLLRTALEREGLDEIEGKHKKDQVHNNLAAHTAATYADSYPK